MAEDLIGYSGLVENALRGVVKTAMRRVLDGGLPGEHHFFITFRTDHPSVEIGETLKARYPGEMTIVLQHQYWDFAVDDEGFGVSLSFNGVPQRLRIGFEAIKLFADPGVEFGLQFTVPEGDGAEGGARGAEIVPGPHGAEPGPEAGRDRAEDDAAGGAEVVTLDRFRKK